MLTSVACSYGCLELVDACLLKLLDHVIALKLAFCKTYLLVVYHALLNLVSNMGCLRVHSKYSLACHWLFYWPGMKAQDWMKNTLVMNMRARTLPSQNACWVTADDMGSRYRWRFPLQVYEDLAIKAIFEYKRYVMDVRLLLFNFCVFSEYWSLESLCTYIRWSRLMSWGPHSAGIRAILTIGSLS